MFVINLVFLGVVLKVYDGCIRGTNISGNSRSSALSTGSRVGAEPAGGAWGWPMVNRVEMYCTGLEKKQLA